MPTMNKYTPETPNRREDRVMMLYSTLGEGCKAEIELAEQAICRAAAEICGLTHWDIEQAATAWEDKFLAMLPEQRKSESAAKLRRFAELAQEKREADDAD